MASKAVMYVTIVSDSGVPAKSLAERVCKRYDQPESAVTAIAMYLEGLVGGNGSAVVHVALAGADTGTQGTGTIACVQANAAIGDRVDIGALNFYVASAEGLGQFSKGANNTECAVNLAAAINAHPGMKGAWVATALTGSVTLTAVTKGTHANLMNLATIKPTAFTLTQVT